MATDIKHPDAFMLMHYKCSKCNYIELIWNSRNSVAPFSVDCPKCGDMSRHVLWNLDTRMIDYIVPKGSRYFAEFTQERAEQVTKERLTSFNGTEFEVVPNTDEYNELYYSLIDSLMNDSCSMDVLTA